MDELQRDAVYIDVVDKFTKTIEKFAPTCVDTTLCQYRMAELEKTVAIIDRTLHGNNGDQDGLISIIRLLSERVSSMDKNYQNINNNVNKVVIAFIMAVVSLILGAVFL